MISSDQQYPRHHFTVQQDNFLNWPAQVKAILKVKGFCHVLGDEDAASASERCQDRTKRTDTTTGEAIGDAYADVVCSGYPRDLARYHVLAAWHIRTNIGRCGGSYVSGIG